MRREHADHAGPGVGRAAHDLDHAGAGVDLAHLQLVGIGMLLASSTRAMVKARELLAGIVDALDLQPDGRQLVASSSTEAVVSR